MPGIDITPRIAVSNAISNFLGVLNVASVNFNVTLPRNRLPEVAKDLENAINRIVKLQASRTAFEQEIIPAINRIAADGIPFYDKIECILQRVKDSHNKLSDDLINKLRSEVQSCDSSFDALAASLTSWAERLGKVHDEVKLPLNVQFDEIERRVGNGGHGYFKTCRDALTRIDGQCRQAAVPLKLYVDNVYCMPLYLRYLRTSIDALFDLLFMSDASAIIDDACTDIVLLAKHNLYLLRGSDITQAYKGDSRLHHYHSNVTGALNANDLHVLMTGQWNNVLDIFTRAIVPFSDIYNSPPPVAVGLTFIDIVTKNQIRNWVTADYTLPDGVASTEAFRLSFEAPRPADLIYDMGASWLELASDNGIQHGREKAETQEWHRSDAVSRDVTFAQPFPEAPRVVAWLAGIDTVQSVNHRFAVRVTDVTSTGFKLVFYTWHHGYDNSVWYAGAAEWVAFRADQPNVAAVHHLATTPGLALLSGHSSEDLVFEFAEAGKRFDQPPHVFTALRLVDFDISTSPRLKIFVKDVTKERAVITVQTWNNSIVNSAGITCIAVAKS